MRHRKRSLAVALSAVVGTAVPGLADGFESGPQRAITHKGDTLDRKQDQMSSTSSRLAKMCIRQAKRGLNATGTQLGHVEINAEDSAENSKSYFLQTVYSPARWNPLCRRVFPMREVYVNLTGDTSRSFGLSMTLLDYVRYPGTNAMRKVSQMTDTPWESQGGTCYVGTVEEYAVGADRYKTKATIFKSPRTAFFVPFATDSHPRAMTPRIGVRNCRLLG